MSGQSTRRRPRGQPTFLGSRFFEVLDSTDNVLATAQFGQEEIGWLNGVIPAAQVGSTEQGTQGEVVLLIQAQDLGMVLRAGARVSKTRRQLETDKAGLRTQLERQSKQIKDITKARDDALTAAAQTRSAFEDAKRDFITVDDLSSSLRELHSEMKKLHGIQASLEKKSQQITQLKQEIKNYKTKHDDVKKQLAQRQTGMKTLRQMKRILHDAGRLRPRRRTPKKPKDESSEGHDEKLLKRRVCYKCQMKGHLAKDCPRTAHHFGSSSSEKAEADDASSSQRSLEANVSITQLQHRERSKKKDPGKHPRRCCCQDCMESKYSEDDSRGNPFPFHKDGV